MLQLLLLLPPPLPQPPVFILGQTFTNTQVYHPKFQDEYSDKNEHSQLSHLKFQDEYSDGNKHSSVSTQVPR
jgi:hypothetical protein